jgi:dCTP deaminase
MIDRPGAIPSQLIAEMCSAGYVQNSNPACLSPSSLDLTITDQCFRMRGSYLPRKGERIDSIITHGSLYKHSLDRPLEIDGTYLIKITETLNLPQGIHATSNSKSSSGRINLRTRLLANGIPRFDSIPAGYSGDLWIEIVPKSFPVLLHPGDRLNQIRFFHGEAKMSDLEHRMLYDKYHLLRDATHAPITPTEDTFSGGITMSIDISSHTPIGWIARPTAWSILDTARYDHDPRDFFEPLYPTKTGELVLRHGGFYILVTKEGCIVPPSLAAEMVAYDPTKGEFRSHFAGFFDPGWGWTEKEETRGWQAVLEIATHGQDVIIRDNQPICVMIYERLITRPDKLYSQDEQSNYRAQQGPKLAKWFKSI